MPFGGRGRECGGGAREGVNRIRADRGFAILQFSRTTENILVQPELVLAVEMEKIDEQLDNKEFEINLGEHPEASEEKGDYLYGLEYSLAEVLRR